MTYLFNNMYRKVLKVELLYKNRPLQHGISSKSRLILSVVTQANTPTKIENRVHI